jgi:hypothetical protein
MAALTALAIASLATTAVSTAQARPAKQPKMPAAPTLPTAPDPVAAAQEKADAVARVRRQRAGGVPTGRTATLLTGASGLASPAPTATKTLLGQ